MRHPSEADKKALYERFAQRYAKRTRGYERFLSDDYSRFVNAVPGRRVLDLGCGPGRDAGELTRAGLDVLCFDLSESMLEICRGRGLQTRQGNMESLELDAGSLDGVWSYTSLTTIPKRKVWKILDQVSRGLVEGGALFLGLIEGDGEGWKPADAKCDVPRFISRYRTDEVVKKLEPSFEIVHLSRIEEELTGRNTYLHFLARRC